VRLLCAAGEAGDATDLGMHTGGHHHHCGAAPGCDVGAGMNHVVAVGQAAGRGQRGQGLEHRHRFAGQRGLGQLQ